MGKYNLGPGASAGKSIYLVIIQILNIYFSNIAIKLTV